MKKLLATFCLALGFASASFAANPTANPAPESPNVTNVQKNDTPDAIIVIFDDRGVIIDIIVIKRR